jgi:DNA-binding PadR family transcriptional regulator
MRGLTNAQAQVLESLGRGFGAHKSITNPSMCALQKKGLVDCEMELRGNGARMERWFLTAAGRAALSDRAPDAGERE